MEYALGILVGVFLFTLGLFVYKFEAWARRVDHLLDWFERENLLLNDVLDWFEEEEEPDTPPSPAANVIKFNRPKKDEAAETEPPVDFWNDLAALKREQQSIESGAGDAGVFDALDHARAVAERIAEIEEASQIKSAA